MVVYYTGVIAMKIETNESIKDIFEVKQTRITDVLTLGISGLSN